MKKQQFINANLNRKDRRSIAFDPKTAVEKIHHERVGNVMMKGVQRKAEAIGRVETVQVGVRTSKKGRDYPVFKKIFTPKVLQ